MERTGDCHVCQGGLTVWAQSWQPFQNYLYAIAEWQKENSEEPPEIIAQKICLIYLEKEKNAFRDELHRTLYARPNNPDYKVGDP